MPTHLSVNLNAVAMLRNRRDLPWPSVPGVGLRVVDAELPGSNIAGLAAEVGADRVEIYTGPYGGTFEPGAKRRELDKVVATGNAANAAGLGLNAGHDLTRDNLPALVAALPHLAEV